MRRNSQLNPMRMLAMLAVLWAAGTWLFAQDNPQRRRRAETATPVTARTLPAAGLAQTAEPPAAPSAATNTAQTPQTETDASAAEPTDRESSTPDKKDAAQDANAPSASQGGTPQRFVPSEQVRADFDVSFPIDI
jgi:cytoskeletal protein RodZ